MGILFWVRRPWLIGARARYWVWEKRNPDKPWMCPGTIDFCEAVLTKPMRALEFGSGRSTRWFGQLVGHVTSVEHDEGWYRAVRQQLAEAQVKNVEYLHVPLDHPSTAPELPAYEPVPRYVAVLDGFADHSLDLIVVDGHYRTTCVRYALSKLSSGGYLLVDDVNMWSTLADVGVPEAWRIADDSTNGIKRCVVWRAP